ncbi:hypothetical protein V5799_027192, partial [Amblyomma americanum]
MKRCSSDWWDNAVCSSFDDSHWLLNVSCLSLGSGHDATALKMSELCWNSDDLLAQ